MDRTAGKTEDDSARRHPAAARLVAVALALVVSLGLAVVPAPPASALAASDFHAGEIITDLNFYDATSMTTAEIQSFLETKGASCRATASAACLKDYVAQTYDRPLEPNLCWGYGGQPGERASAIIAHVASSCGISPKVLLVLLQKEQGLVTSSGPTSGKYDKATGFACPDTAACDTRYYGLFNQLYSAARQFKNYGVNASRFGYRANRENTIRYNPDVACGASTVYIANQATASLYNYTPYQPNAAALANLGGTGDACSAYGKRNFWRYYSTWFGSTGKYSAIDAKWVGSGGDAGPLGGRAAPEYCDGAGCWRRFASGIVAWSPATGAQAVTGGHATTYLALGGSSSALGQPTSDEVRTSTGSYVLYQGGTTHWSPATGVHAVTGGHATTYYALGGSTGALGYPTSDEIRTATGSYVMYQGGTTHWSPATGVHAVTGGHATTYLALGGSSSALGYPTSDEIRTATGSYVMYQGGTTHWSPATGVHAVTGGHATTYYALGGSTGLLGYPTSDEVRTATGSHVLYQGGATYWSPTTGVQTVTGATLAAYTAAGGPDGALGHPLAAAEQTRSGELQRFQGGYVVRSGSTAAPLTGALLSAYEALGGRTGALGQPVRGQTTTGATSTATFERGMLVATAGGVRAVTGGHATTYTALGGPGGLLGLPTTDEVRTATGSYVMYQGGTTHWSPATGVHAVTGGHATTYYALGGSSSALGYPTSDEIRTATGSYVLFQGGTTHWSPATGVHAVTGGHATTYYALGGSTGALGYPTTDEVRTATGSHVLYQGGATYWSPTTGVHAVPGAALAAYTAAGGPDGPLGYPVSGPTATSGGTSQTFARGTITTVAGASTAQVTVLR